MLNSDFKKLQSAKEEFKLRLGEKMGFQENSCNLPKRNLNEEKLEPDIETKIVAICQRGI